MVPPPRLRVAEPDDLPEVALVRARSWQAAYAGLVPHEVLATLDEPERLDRWVATYSGWGFARTVVAEDDGRIVGFTSSGPERGPDDLPCGVRGRGEVYAIYTLPSVWGTGAGRDLLHHTLDELVSSGYDHVTLWVLEGNSRAQRFYVRHGFAPTGERAQPADFLPELRYARRL